MNGSNTLIFKSKMSLFTDRVAFIATMHQKEKIIAPLMENSLGLRCTTLQTFDTDVFGTFTGEVQRPASQLETLRMKCQKGLEISGLEICIASEGAFGAHPTLSFLAADIEMLMLIDKKNNLEVVGQVLTTETNFATTGVSAWEEALEFAEQIGFPEHALVITVNTSPSKNELEKKQTIAKGINQFNELQYLVNKLLKENQSIHLETDMRAMHNPTRRKVIAQTTQELIKKLLSSCPQCGTLGFSPSDFRLGLPCENCGLPTQQVYATIWKCAKCNFVKEEIYPQGNTTADATYCSFCNP